MTNPGISYAKRFLLTGLLAGALVSSAADAATVSVLYSFQNNGKDGFLPAASLMEINGTLYGTTEDGGTGRCNNGCGTIFSINATTGAETILHSFSNAEQAGVYPGSLTGAGSTLFGTTANGGHRDAGMLFSYDLASNKFKEQYYFCNLDNCSDGADANPGLLDENGVLYGTTEFGGPGQNCESGCGTVFAFDTNTQTETILHAFGTGVGDGTLPLAGLLKVGHRLYGMTNEGGNAFYGTVFSIDAKTGGESIVYAFCSQQNCADGGRPNGNLIRSNDMLYGTTEDGGTSSDGTVFSIDPTTHAETVLHSFQGPAYGDGAFPTGGLVYANGLLYGTTLYGGANCTRGCGTVYSIDPATGAEAVVYSFCNLTDCADGVAPQSTLLNVNGTFYGVAAYGGTGTCTTENELAGCGTVFTITP